MATSLSLANKYRPQTFEDGMIGQHAIREILEAKMQSSRDNLQNYLLTWPRGTGKTTTARILAKAINCLNPHNGNPCNECANCVTINTNVSLDYVEIDAASHTGVDNIREEILDKALYPPTSLKKKIYIIDEVHMLSKGAFNSLLKTIEEPKGNVCFILATTEIHKVPDTIVSRCQVFNFKKVSEEEIANHLASICDKEGFSYEKPALELIANISDGGVRDAVKYLDQVSILGNITQENASRFLGISSEATIKDFLDTLKKGERNQIFQAIDTINTNGIDLHQFAKQILGFIDKHLLEDTDFYLQISEAFSPILRQIRYYPYPAVIYKIALAPFASGTNDIPTPRIENPTKSKEEENPIIVLPVREKDPVVQQEEEGLPTTNKEEGVSNDLPTLRTTLTAKLSKPTVQSNLKDHVIIEKIENGTAHLVVTNKIAEMLLQNADNKKEIETLLSTELWAPTTISFIFEAKEGYFARTLGL